MLTWDLRQTTAPVAVLQLSSEPCFALACVAGKTKDLPGTQDIATEGPKVAVGASDAILESVNSHPHTIIAGGASKDVSWLTLDLTAGKLIRRRACMLAEEGVGDVCVRSDGRIAAVGTWEGTVRLYHARRAKQLAVLKHHKRTVAAVAFQPTSGVLASGGRDGSIALWSVYDDG